jgi:hypothetical protein
MKRLFIILVGVLLICSVAAAQQRLEPAAHKLNQLKTWLSGQIRATTDESQRAHYFFDLAQIKKFEENPKELNLTRPSEPPDGAPIGSDCDWPM